MATNSEKWAYVSLNNKEKRVVRVKDILKFNPDNYDNQKQYYMMIDGVTVKGIILFIKDSKEEIEKTINTKRVPVPSRSYIQSASELSELEGDSFTEDSNNNISSLSGIKNKSQIAVMSNAKKKNKTSSMSEGKNKFTNIPSSETKKTSKMTSANDNGEKKREILKAASLKRKNSKEPPSNIPSKKAIIVLKKNIVDELQSDLQCQNIAAQEKNDDNYVSLHEHDKVKSQLRELKAIIRSLEQQLEAERQKNSSLQASVNKIVSDNKVQTKISNDIAKILESFEEYKKNAQLPSTSAFPPIGFENTESSTVHIGHDTWIDADTFYMVMGHSSPTIVIRDLCRALFSTAVLLRSTVSGNPTNKNKKEKEKNNIHEPVQGLSSIKLHAIRDTLEYYLNKRHQEMSQLKKDAVLGNVRTVISSLISDLKKKEKKNKITEKQESTAGKKNKDKEENIVNEENMEEEENMMESEDTVEEENRVEEGNRVEEDEIVNEENIVEKDKIVEQYHDDKKTDMRSDDNADDNTNEENEDRCTSTDEEDEREDE